MDEDRSNVAIYNYFSLYPYYHYHIIIVHVTICFPPLLHSWFNVFIYFLGYTAGVLVHVH